MPPTPKYSVVIATRNRKKTLLLTLRSVAAQNIPANLYEVLVVDDGSSDGTDEMVSEFQKQNPGRLIKYFRQQHAGPSKARNRGIRESRGEIIFFTDDDCTVPENWLEVLLGGYQRYPEAVGVGGWTRPATQKLADRYFQKYFTFIEKNSFPDGFSGSEIRGNIFAKNLYDHAGNTANMSYRREIFDKVGWFDESITFAGGVDWDLKIRVQKNGYYLVYLPFFVGHLKDYNLKNFVKKFFMYGRGYHFISRKYAFLENSPAYRNTPYFFIARVLTFALREKKFILAHCIRSIAELAGSFYMRLQLRSKEIVPESFSDGLVLERTAKKIGCEKVIITRLFPTAEGGGVQVSPNYRRFCSVVVATYNRSQLLPKTLGSLKQQTAPREYFEIIVVDDGSTDNTREVVLKFKEANPSYSILYLYQKNAGPASARNLGTRHAKGEIIFFTDDDCILPDNWIETLLRKYEQYPGIAGAGGWTLPVGEARSSLIDYMTVTNFSADSLLPPAYLRTHEIMSNNPLWALSVFVYNTANISYRKSVLQEVEGFREEYKTPGREDNDLAFRVMDAGYNLLYTPFFVRHTKKLDLISFAKMQFERGINYRIFLSLNRKKLCQIHPRVSESHYGFGELAAWLFWRPYKILSLIHFLSYSMGVTYQQIKERPCA